MNNLPIAGLIMAAIVAGAAFVLSHWEKVRPNWPRQGPLDRLSDKLRRLGLLLLWFEALLMAIGAQIPTSVRADRLLFVSIWAVVGIVAIVMVTIAIGDSIVRLLAHRVRSAAIAEVWNQRIDEMELDQTDDSESTYETDPYDEY
jgi:hypothetical protein